jgi:hypothetical protein
MSWDNSNYKPKPNALSKSERAKRAVEIRWHGKSSIVPKKDPKAVEKADKVDDKAPEWLKPR